MQDEDITIHQHCRYRTEYRSPKSICRYVCKRHADGVRILHSSGDLQVDPRNHNAYDNLVILAAMFDVTMDDIVAVDSFAEKYG